jgi:flagellar basal-body rod modification protein FlgD
MEKITNPVDLIQLQPQNGPKDRQVGYLDQDQFLQLLLAQIQNQDPLSPKEGSEFAADLAQFASLESLNNIDSKMKETMLAQQAATAAANNALASSMIGKEILAAGEQAALNNGVAELQIALEGLAEKVTVSVFDADGVEVKTLIFQGLDGGAQNLEWDGTDNNGEQLPDGNYRYRVHATDSDGNTVASLTTSVGIVTGVSFSGGYTLLMMGDIAIPLGDVVSFRDPGE